MGAIGVGEESILQRNPPVHHTAFHPREVTEHLPLLKFTLLVHRMSFEQLH